MKFKRIIILDDNNTTLFLHRDLATEYFPGAEIITFSDAQEFLDKITENDFWIKDDTLLLLDINMPKYFGYELLEEIEEEYDELGSMSVIMVTSSNLRRDIERADRFPNVIGYIEKPLNGKKLDQILKSDQ